MKVSFETFSVCKGTFMTSARRCLIADPDDAGEGESVNAQELRSAIPLIGIPERLIVVGDTAEFAWCVTEADDGAWEVYWMERGNKNDLERFENENQACTYMLGRLAYTQILGGMRYGGVETA